MSHKLKAFHESPTTTTLWRYRGFVLGSVRREFEARYVRSMFGLAWAVLEPLSMIVIYTLIFSKVMRTRLPGVNDTWSYSVYLCAGILTWGLFAETLTRCQTMFLDRAELLRKSRLPRLALPLIVSISTMINFLIAFCILLVFLACIGRFPGWSILWFIPLLVVQQCFAMGLGVITGTLNVFFRDVGKGIGILLTFWFWMTPIVYPLGIIPPSLRNLVVGFNPLSPLILAYQSILLDGNMLCGVRDLAMPGIFALVSLALGYRTFLYLSAELVDEL